MLAPGDIVRIYAAQAGRKKYHLFVSAGVQGQAHRLLFLNSETKYRDTLAVKCERISFLPQSRTGLTGISCSQIARYTDKNLQDYRAEKLGVMPVDVLIELRAFMDQVTSLTAIERRETAAALDTMIVAIGGG